MSTMIKSDGTAWTPAEVERAAKIDSDGNPTTKLLLLIDLLQESKMHHRHCDDSWYCCGACVHLDHGPLYDIDQEPDQRKAGVCNCGADQWNARIEEALR